MSWSDIYDGWAASYDDDTAGGWHPNKCVGELLARLHLAPTSVLDLGAGTGQTATMVRGLYPDARLTLVDGSAAMADVARGKHPDVEVVVADLDAHLAADTASYDLVVAVGVLELVPSLAASLEAASRRVTPGGHLAITHEPLLSDSVVQGKVENLHGEARWVRRLEHSAVEQIAVNLGLARVAARDHAAYRRGDVPEDAVYEAVVWRR